MPITEFYTPSEQIHERIVFCDFDGTITKEETFVAILKEFSPNLASEIIPQIYERKISLRDGVKQILESIPAERIPDIIKFSEGREIRKGFEKLADFLALHQIPLVIVSGGLREVVLNVIGDLVKKIEKIYAVEIVNDGGFTRVISPYEDSNELVSKPSIMRLYNFKEAVSIGDSITDLAMSLEADIVFARDRLCGYLNEHNKAFYEWSNFIDVMNQLKTLWQLYERKGKKKTD